MIFYKIRRKFFHFFLARGKKFFLLCYAKKSRALTGGKNIFLLSFDCDNPEDITAIKKITPFLEERKIKASFAVPGEIFARDPDFFKKLEESGNEILAHGWQRHSEIREGRYVSTLFYDKLDDESLKDDIVRGIEALRLAGIKVSGFRIPHFGHSNSKKELRRVYKILLENKIEYSSSTVPEFALRRGPLFENWGIVELPISPCYSSPLSILDTYNFGFSRKSKFGFSDYFKEFSKTINFFGEKGVVLNLYGDPSQAVLMDSWFKSVDLAYSRGYKFMTLAEFYLKYEKSKN